ncbi:glycosyltransferase family 2 protein [Schauerella aestuarii]|uniref:glycosyltransferase family 2 protein n=1 Tax=Schauerella aestuarii TaxID=2511204 RepID=UPI001F396077|nr:glycosyltransferase family 2 protein [Achromobacter aestuarii]
MNILYIQGSELPCEQGTLADVIVHGGRCTHSVWLLRQMHARLGPHGVYIALFEEVSPRALAAAHANAAIVFAHVDAVEAPTKSESASSSPSMAAPSRPSRQMLLACKDTKSTPVSPLMLGIVHELIRQRAISETLAGDLIRVQSYYDGIRQSRFWRATAPMRQAGNTVKNVASVGRYAKTVAGRHGGWSNALSAAMNAYRHLGFKGVLRKLTTSARSLQHVEASSATYSYAEWVARYDTLEAGRLETLRAELNALDDPPLISIVVPVFNAPEATLRAMLDSVIAQIYGNWELCIADDMSPGPHVRAVLDEYAGADNRIKIVYRTQNGHISEASNSALEIATGEFVALLDHDDILPPHALFMVVKYLAEHPDADLLYSDEDKINERGERVDPYFKPDWNPELLRTQNYFCHFGVYRTALIREVGGFRMGFEGSQDHDLVLRCVERVPAQNIVHIPHVLYHWRISAGSTAAGESEKPYAQDAAFKAIDEHLARCGVKAHVELTPAGQRHICYALPDPAPLVTIVIPTKDGVGLLKQCIDSVLGISTYRNIEILIVDNGSTEPATLAYFDGLTGQPDVRVMRDPRPFNYSALNNAAVQEAQGEFICLMNNDIQVITPGWLEEMVGLAMQPGAGCVGARLWYPNDTLQHGGVILGIGGIAGHSHLKLARGEGGYFSRAALTQNLSCVTAACLVVSRSVYREVDGLDEGLAVAFNDVDFCLRVREAGYRNVYAAFAELYHHESATRGSDLTPEKQLRFQSECAYMKERWGDALTNDPAYNPNLDLKFSVPTFLYADPPRIGQFE